MPNAPYPKSRCCMPRLDCANPYKHQTGFRASAPRRRAMALMIGSLTAPERLPVEAAPGADKGSVGPLLLFGFSVCGNCVRVSARTTDAPSVSTRATRNR
jgi:hypothetical protein